MQTLDELPRARWLLRQLRSGTLSLANEIEHASDEANRLGYDNYESKGWNNHPIVGYLDSAAAVFFGAVVTSHREGNPLENVITIDPDPSRPLPSTNVMNVAQTFRGGHCFALYVPVGTSLQYLYPRSHHYTPGWKKPTRLTKYSSQYSRLAWKVHRPYLSCETCSMTAGTASASRYRIYKDATTGLLR